VPDPVYPERIAVKVDLGAGYVELADVQLAAGIQVQRGIQGTGIQDRVAGPGSMSFQLDNSEHNSVGLLGYYSRNNVNCMAGWDIGAPIMLVVTFLGVEEPVFVGTIEAIEPMSGKYRDRKVSVHCVDWMDEAANAKVTGLTVQTSKRSDELLTLLLGLVTRTPTATLIDFGADIYPYAFDNALDAEQSLMSELQTLVVCEQGYLYILRDGTLVFQSRHRRPNVFAIAETLTDADIFDLDTGRGREEIVNKATVVSHPRHVDPDATTVLYTCPDVPSIPRGVSQEFNALYRDPTAKATRVGCVQLTSPVATTDFTFNTQDDGLGTDITAQLTVTVLDNGGQGSANSATVQVSNAGPLDGYLTKFQLRGKGIYDYNTAQMTSESAASITEYGENSTTIDMPYQSDSTVAGDVAAYIVQQGKGLLTQISSVTFCGNQEERLMRSALQVDIGDKIELSETMVGTAGIVPPGETLPVVVTKFFIQAVGLRIQEDVIWCTWTVTPADAFTYWVLDKTGYTELDLTTRLASGSFFAGWIVGQSTLATDTFVNA
jgi:hypothetical protein